MKIHYINILLFALPLNILVTSSSSAHNKTKLYITSHHTPIYTSRVLSECDTESSIYDSDEEINSVKEIFERQTSQRFEEYQERMKEKRQKRKEQRDKNIQKIIHKDKMEKNLAEKIEKGCLMCGCGLGSVAGSVGLFGGIIINIWKPGAITAAIDKGIAAGATKIAEAAEAARILAGNNAVIAGIKSTFRISTLNDQTLVSYFTTTSYNDVTNITQAVYKQYLQTCASDSSGRLLSRLVDSNRHIHICRSVFNQTQAVSQRSLGISHMNVIETTVETMVSDAEVPAKAAAEVARQTVTAEITKEQTTAINSIFMSKQTVIIASVVALLIIVLVMIIIYLVLRYRRKKKMKKKAQYTKLLNE
ncbi:rifin PIR protein, putative [Plasmodium reichenowi]|uniref:Rifin PIR protein, putative n=1 Tax=Plasmodium reichenowi TaxID=5854 RepID=A0A2P9DT68_PLARE|nr:rifin PIR protein, putative [Plasmodium reichenowi]